MTTTPTDGRGAWKKFICLACGYIYDEALGDPEDGLPAGTRFEDIPEDWQCPLCGVKKSDFVPYEQTAAPDAPLVHFDDVRRGVVIIGGGLAGWSVVEAVRALDADIPITLIAADSADRYHKPMLSVAMSQQKTRADLVRTSAQDAALALKVRLLSETFVVHIDSSAKVLHTTRGHVAYDDLVFAIGASPAYPPMIAKDKAWHINSLEKFSKLQNALQQARHVAIVGAGMIGLEFAEDLTKAGYAVSLIDVYNYPLSSLLPKEAGARVLQAVVQRTGVAWFGGMRIQCIQDDPNGKHVITLQDTKDNTHTITCDTIVVATGLLVAERLPMRAGITFDKRTGIAVNPQTLQTSKEHIYALGDCISIDGVPCRYVAPHRPQAAAIASQILGQDGTYTHKPPMIRLKNKSVSVTITGTPNPHGTWQIITDTDETMILHAVEQDAVIAKATIQF